MNKKYLIPLIVLVVVVGGLLMYFRIEQNKITEAREKLLTNGVALMDDKKAFGQFLLDNEQEMQKIMQGKNILGIQIKAKSVSADVSYYDLWCDNLLSMITFPEVWAPPGFTINRGFVLSMLSMLECEI